MYSVNTKWKTYYSYSLQKIGLRIKVRRNYVYSQYYGYTYCMRTILTVFTYYSRSARKILPVTIDLFSTLLTIDLFDKIKPRFLCLSYRLKVCLYV